MIYYYLIWRWFALFVWCLYAFVVVWYLFCLCCLCCLLWFTLGFVCFGWVWGECWLLALCFLCCYLLIIACLLFVGWFICWALTVSLTCWVVVYWFWFGCFSLIYFVFMSLWLLLFCVGLLVGCLCCRVLLVLVFIVSGLLCVALFGCVIWLFCGCFVFSGYFICWLIWIC